MGISDRRDSQGKPPTLSEPPAGYYLKLNSVLFLCSLLSIPFQSHFTLRPIAAPPPTHIHVYMHQPTDLLFLLLLFRCPSQLNIVHARGFYKRFLEVFPTASAYWKVYVDHEQTAKCYPEVGKIHAMFACWKCVALRIRWWKRRTEEARHSALFFPSPSFPTSADIVSATLFRCRHFALLKGQSYL